MRITVSSNNLVRFTVAVGAGFVWVRVCVGVRVCASLHSFVRPRVWKA